MVTFLLRIPRYSEKVVEKRRRKIIKMLFAFQVNAKKAQKTIKSSLVTPLQKLTRNQLQFRNLYYIFDPIKLYQILALSSSSGIKFDLKNAQNHQKSKCDALRDLVSFLQFKKRHLKPAT